MRKNPIKMAKECKMSYKQTHITIFTWQLLHVITRNYLMKLALIIHFKSGTNNGNHCFKVPWGLTNNEKDIQKIFIGKKSEN